MLPMGLLLFSDLRSIIKPVELEANQVKSATSIFNSNNSGAKNSVLSWTEESNQ